MKRLLKLFRPEKVLSCPSCNARFKFPVKPGKVLKVTCPKCRMTYKVSFVNPLKELLTGKMKWSNMGHSERRTILVLILTLLVSLGMILSSLKSPIKPKINDTKLIENVD